MQWNRSKRWFILVCCSIAHWGFAQTSIQDSLFVLPTVELAAQRPSLLELGHSQWQLDSNQLALLPTASISDIFLQMGGAYLKHYGPGRLATAGVRGSSAQQTVVLWEGVPITNPMLGQNDLSLLPAFFFENTSLVLGSASVQAGSGAVGGVLQLRGASPAVENGFRLNAQVEQGSFGHWFGGMKFGAASETIKSQTKLFYQTAENNFEFQTINNSTERLHHAQVIQGGLLQSIAWNFHPKHTLQAHLWYQQTDRQLPPTRVQARSDATQLDESLRALLQWDYRNPTVELRMQAAYLWSRLDFLDPTANIVSKSTMPSYFANAQLRWHLAKAHTLHFQTEVQGSNANTTAFEANPSQHRQGLVGTYRWHPISSPLQIQLGARQDWQDGQRSPFLPELKIQWNQRTMRAFAHISRSFRWPTLNDRFWEPGGNPNLLPEQGWSQEVGSKWYFQHKTWSYQMGFNAFARQSDNWIIWVPEGLFFSPQNVRTVNHWGISPSFSTSYSINSWRIQLKSNYHWLSAVNSQSNIPNDQSEGKQLIYVPTHQADAQLQLDYAAWQLSYVHQWMGQIYTLGDHSQSIPAFQLAFLGLSKKWRFGQQQLHTYLQIRNIWNTDYEFVIQRPMPGRHCRVGVAYTLSSLKNN